MFTTPEVMSIWRESGVTHLIISIYEQSYKPYFMIEYLI